MSDVPLRWPAQRRAQAQPLNSRERLAAAHIQAENHPAKFATLVKNVEKGNETAGNLDQTVRDLIEQTSLDFATPSREEAEAILALACVDVLGLRPDQETWTYLWSLRYSGITHLEWLLEAAIAEAARADAAFAKKFLEIAEGITVTAANNPGHRERTKPRYDLKRLREHWLKHKELQELWSGRHEIGPFDYRDDDGALKIVADFAPKAFVELLSIFDSPYPVSALLLEAGASFNYERWSAFASAAPTAFDDDHAWNGSLVAPILMSIGRDALSQAALLGRIDVPEDALKAAAAELTELSEAIVKIVAGRPDAEALAERWARSHGYTELVLIQSLLKALPVETWRLAVARDAAPWEFWCHTCLLVIVSSPNGVPMPSSEAFIQQWALTPEAWGGAAGALIEDRASIFLPLGGRADSFGVRILAIPIAEASDPVTEWLRLWNICTPLRETIEFGSYEDRRPNGTTDMMAAGRLMQLVLSLGLMTLDAFVDKSRNIRGDRNVLAMKLLGLLKRSVQDMSAIDHLNSSYWVDTYRHLLVRRAKWTDKVEGLAVELGSVASPTLSEFLRYVANDTEMLLAVTQVMRMNGVRDEIQRSALHEANVDLAQKIDVAEQL